VVVGMKKHISKLDKLEKFLNESDKHKHIRHLYNNVDNRHKGDTIICEQLLDTGEKVIANYYFDTNGRTREMKLVQNKNGMVTILEKKEFSVKWHQILSDKLYRKNKN